MKTLRPLLAVVMLFSLAVAQTNPAPQSIPYSQNFGTTTFTALPPGIGAWNSISGAATYSQAIVETTQAKNNATVTAASVAQQTGGVYGYATNNNAQIYVQTSSNTTNGTNEIALALNTSGAAYVKLSYKVTMISAQPRGIGFVVQYRIGTIGGWTSIAGSTYYHSGNDRSAGTEDLYADLVLPGEAGNQPSLQLRWAVWRQDLTGANSSGIGIDDISVVSTGSGVFVPNPKLFVVSFTTVDRMNVSWEPPTGSEDDSVLVFVREDSAVSVTPSGQGILYNNASSDFTTAGTYGVSRLVYNGTENNATITGLTPLKRYFFRAFSYRDTAFSSGTPHVSDTADVKGASSVTAVPGDQHAIVSWLNNPAPQGVWWDEVLVIVKSGSATDGVPTGDGSAYVATPTFGSGTQVGVGNFVVYKGTDNTITVTGLTNAAQYAFRIFVRRGTSWTPLWRSPGVTATPSNGPLIPVTPQLIAPANGAAGVSTSPQCLWTSVEGAAAYQVQISTLQDVASPSFDATVNSTNYIPTSSLPANTKMYWHVRASNSAGFSTYSETYSFTTASQYQVPQQFLYNGQSGSTLLSSVVAGYKPSSTQSYPPPALFSTVYNVNGTVRCVYTGTVAANGSGMNIEHTFPQSKGASGQAKSDMHHLFPTLIGVNSDRGNYPYSDIPENEVSYWYRLATKTPSKPTLLLDEYSRVKSGVTFEPRADHKGNVARAIFYFYTMYKSQADAADPTFFSKQMSTLYRWHYLDPVDSAEYARSVQIGTYQSGKANPFILDTTLLRRAYFPSIGAVSVSEDVTETPSTILLMQNYPNPFNPTTAISYQLSAISRVRLSVFDVLGREIARLVDREESGGMHRIMWDATGFPSGIYFYRLTTPAKTESRRLLLLR